ncbi:MAG: hypothetical protein ACEQSR_11505 [Candidatus Methylacidiphilales bacterium]
MQWQKKLIMPIVYLYISLLKRITEIFQRHIRASFTDDEAYHLISFYEVFIFANIIFKTQYSGALFIFGFIIILVGNYFIFEKLYWKIIIPNNKIYKSKALLNTLFILITIWFVYSFNSIFQKIPTEKENLKYYRPLPPNQPDIDTGIKRYYNY